jgi:hypothetical protein
MTFAAFTEKRCGTFNGDRRMEKNDKRDWSALAAAWTLPMLLAGCITPPQKQPVVSPAAPVVSSAAAAPTAPKPLQKEAFSATPQNLGYFSEINPDCTPVGRPIILITNPPAHGSVTLDNDAQSYPTFPSSNQRYECNKKKNLSVGVTYTSESGFVGTDRFSLKRISFSGDAATTDYVVTVEPARRP